MISLKFHSNLSGTDRVQSDDKSNPIFKLAVDKAVGETAFKSQ